MTVTELLIVLGMAVAVYLPKAAPLVVVSERLTARLRGWLEYVAPAVLGALVAPRILAPTGDLAPPTWDQSSLWRGVRGRSGDAQDGPVTGSRIGHIGGGHADPPLTGERSTRR
jgi:branched-subunit amino acid transport protein